MSTAVERFPPVNTISALAKTASAAKLESGAEVPGCKARNSASLNNASDRLKSSSSCANNNRPRGLSGWARLNFCTCSLAFSNLPSFISLRQTSNSCWMMSACNSGKKVQKSVSIITNGFIQLYLPVMLQWWIRFLP